MASDRLLLKIALTATAMLLVAAAVLYPVVTDERGTQITQYRNAFLAERATSDEWQWRGDQPPPSFNRLREPVPDALMRWLDRNALPAGFSDWQQARHIGSRLHDYARKGGPIASDVVETLRLMERLKTGYCADYVRVFEALAHAAGISTRQWAFSFDGFGGWGHTVNEVWDRETQRWYMIDVFGGFVPLDQAQRPLSALEFRQLLRTAPEQLVFSRLHPDNFGFKDDAGALGYYLRGKDEWYLWNGNHSLHYDADPWVQSARRFGRAAEQVTAMLRGTIAPLKIVTDPTNEQAFEALIRLRWGLIAAFVAQSALGSVLLYYVVVAVRRWLANRGA